MAESDVHPYRTGHEVVTCALCGATENVRTGLIEWKAPRDGKLWETIPRCIDHEECRARAILARTAAGQAL